MQRRTVLRRSGAAVASTLSLPVVGTRSARATAGSSPRVGSGQDESGYEPLGRLEIEGAAEAVVGDDDVAYLATTTGFATVDVSEPAEPELLFLEDDIEVDGDPFLEILDVAVDGDRLVVPGPANRTSGRLFEGFCCYDVSDPAAPELVAEPYETGFHIHNCSLEDDVLYVVGNDPSDNVVVVYDVADGVERIGRWSLLEHEPGWADVDWIARYLHDVSVHDDVAYLAHWNPGTYLLDVSDPAEPEYISHVSETDLQSQRSVENDLEIRHGLPGNDHYATVDETGDLLAVGREAWATGGEEPDGPGGIDLYDVSNSEDPVSRGSIEPLAAADESYDAGLWTTAHNFELRNDRLYAAWYRGGVTIHDVSDPDDPERLAAWRDPHVAGFWTARVLEPGETFVASSTQAIPNAPTEGALYTFPIETGEQADPPSLTDPDAFDLDGVDRDDDGNESAADADDGDDGAEGNADDSIPGFTGTAAGFGLVSVAGGAAALEWVRRRRR
ncbi:hypothetical protein CHINAEXTREME_19100 [Halobiforma lacisalsi AJ5]|uniref:LVIVD repeat-containing protein n=1 Tax=Natronobacterium lacisalsi AJ5 TaxID=358396 RepID=M0LSG3_NATLA|nr:hypothetical protein [Halobiforma lacisalsi]APW99747.1 hypothetical protein CHINAEXTREME_19100 [Halobiforma lacisalsi AJ5]EMA36078.1 LVIVD repeat-containing protein [Halobiforma lacisalsi AJ5]